jgi:hypothetical protein
VAGLLLFAAIACAYVTLTIKVLLRSELIDPVPTSVGWHVVEKLLAFPAFYFGPDPLTGLIINAAIWGFVMTKVLLWLWSLSKRRNVY